MSTEKVLLVNPDAKAREVMSSILASAGSELLVESFPGVAAALAKVAAGEYSAAVCVVESPEDLAAVVRIRKLKPDLSVVALTDGAAPGLRNLARQMGASSVVDRAADPARTGLQLAAAIRSKVGEVRKSAESVRRTASEIRQLNERSRELVARAMAVLASSNDRPFVVLHVDDDAYEEFALRRLLIRAGLPSFVRSFRSPAEAVRYLLGEGEYADRVLHPLPSLVISDLRMGLGMDGVEFLAWIRSRPELRSLGFMLVTSSEAEEDVRRAAETGANLYVVKSIRMDCVVDVIRSAYASWVSLSPEKPAPLP